MQASKSLLRRSFCFAPAVSGRTTGLDGFPANDAGFASPVVACGPAVTDIEGAKPIVEQTTLANGIKVITQDAPGQATSVIALFVDAGSRDETEATAGATHLLDHCFFKSTTNRSHIRLTRDVERMGGNLMSVGGREHSLVSVDLLRDDVGAGVEIIGDTILNSRFTEHEVDTQKAAIAAQVADMAGTKQAELLSEYTHQAAFSGVGVGAPLIADDTVLANANPDTLRNFMAANYTGSRMVLSASGVNHADFVGYANEFLGAVPTGSAANRTPSTYTGGVATVAGGKQDFVHVSLGFKAPGWKDDDFVATNVLQYIMGGGSSFSVGGPGKGMYSRLFQNVLNRHYWVNSAQAFTSFFEDTGVFGVSGSTTPRSGTKPLVEVMCGELGAMGKGLSDAEVNRAKNQLKLALYTNVEDRTMAVDDMARQALVYGKYTPAAEICAKIDAVTTAQLSSVAQQIISSEPTLTLYGDSTGMPSMDFVKSKF